MSRASVANVLIAAALLLGSYIPARAAGDFDSGGIDDVREEIVDRSASDADEAEVVSESALSLAPDRFLKPLVS